LDRLVLLATICLLPGCAARQAIPIAAGADLVTTELAVAGGAVEQNPIPGLQTSGGRVVWKMAGTVFLVWLCERLERDGHHRSAEILMWGTVGAWGAAATWNATHIR
jgi:hypothetical protein